MMDTVTVTVTIPSELYDELTVLADETYRTVDLAAAKLIHDGIRKKKSYRLKAEKAAVDKALVFLKRVLEDKPLKPEDVFVLAEEEGISARSIMAAMDPKVCGGRIYSRRICNSQYWNLIP